MPTPEKDQTVVSQKILIKTHKYSNYFYGDKISISGKIKIPENFENKNGKIFDYKNYLLKDQITHIAFYPQTKIISKEEKKDFKFYIFKFKNIFITKINKLYSDRTSSFILGVLLGSKSIIDDFLEENFRRTGLIHILVLSGFNLTIITFFVFKLLSILHRNIRFILSLFFIVVFIIMVGAGATVVRAGIMITIFIIGKIFYRNSNSLNALFLAASIMIFQNPIILLYDPSFQLSFVATAGLVSFYEYIEKCLNWLPNKFSIKEIITSNIAVQLTITPLIIFLMGEFSVISLVPNILVLPLIPIFMLSSFLSVLVSFINFSPRALNFSLICITELLSNIIILIVNFFGNLDFAMLKTNIINSKNLPFILFLYLIIIIFLEIRKKFVAKQKYNYLQS